MKDVPTDLPAELHIGITTKREDPRDVLISKEKMRLADLPLKARIGTSSLRRSAQLLAYRGDLEIVPLRGNLDTRIRKLKTESLHAVIVAAAGINRMGIKDVITEYLPVEIMLPAIGQGALGIELRREDKDLLEAISFLNHTETAITVRAERSYLKRLEGGCQVPIGAFGEIRDGQLILRGIVADPSGARFFKKDMIGSLSDPESLGTALAEDILGMGARQVLEEVYERTLD
jgi:hydroxymethylbilane synthase